MSRLISSDSDSRKATYWKEKQEKKDPSYYKRTQAELLRLHEARRYAKAVNAKRK